MEFNVGPVKKHDTEDDISWFIPRKDLPWK